MLLYRRTAADYFTLAGAILVMNNIILGMLVQIMHVPVYPAKLITECILFTVSWLVQNKLIFSRKRRLQFRMEKLDSGNCSFMTYRGSVISHPYKPGKEVSDGIFITEAI